MNEQDLVTRAIGAPFDIETTAYAIRWIFSGERTVGTKGTLGFCVVRLGERNPLHSHPNCEEMLYLISGRLEHRVGDAVVVLDPGDAIRVPEGTLHQAHAIGDTAATMVVFYNVPFRQTTEP